MFTHSETESIESVLCLHLTPEGIKELLDTRWQQYKIPTEDDSLGESECQLGILIKIEKLLSHY